MTLEVALIIVGVAIVFGLLAAIASHESRHSPDFEPIDGEQRVGL